MTETSPGSTAGDLLTLVRTGRAGTRSELHKQIFVCLSNPDKIFEESFLPLEWMQRVDVVADLDRLI